MAYCKIYIYETAYENICIIYIYILIRIYKFIDVNIIIFIFYVNKTYIHRYENMHFHIYMKVHIENELWYLSQFEILIFITKLFKDLFVYLKECVHMGVGVGAEGMNL